MRTTCSIARSLARRFGPMAGTLLAAALLAVPAAAQTTNGTFRTLGGTGEPGYQDGVKGVTQFRNPAGVAVNGDGHLYVADSGNNAVRRLRLSDQTVGTYIGSGLNVPVALAFDTSTNLFVANQGNSSISRFDAFGNLREVLRPPLTGGQITAMAIDGGNYLYVAQLNGVVTRVSPTGFIVGTYSALGDGRPHQFRGVAVADDGAVFASDAAQHVIWRFGGPGEPAQVFAGDLGFPGKVLGDPGVGQLNQPHQIAIAPNGSLAVADRGNHQIRGVSCEGVITILAGIDPSKWFTFSSPEVFPGWWDSSPEFAELREPVGVIVDRAGVVYDSEAYYHLIRRGAGLSLPSCGGVTPGPINLALLLSPNQGFYPEGVEVRVTSATGSSFPANVLLFYTLDGSDPTLGSTPVVIENGIGRINITDQVDLGFLRVRAFQNGVGGPVAAGLAPLLPLPGLNPPSGYFITNVVITITNAGVPSGLFPAGTRLFYTRDRSEPTQSSQEVSLIGGIGRLELQGPINLENLRVRAFLGNSPGPIVGGLPTSDIPNRISWGFPIPQPASSDFVASAGQMFYAPVTLTLKPGQTMYGLQYAMSITNLTGPAAPAYRQGFTSLLLKPDPTPGSEGNYLRIPPQTFTHKDIFTYLAIINDNVVIVTNYIPRFTNLVVTNLSQGLTAVGWFERFRQTNLYNTLQHDLIRYSSAHNLLFESGGGKVVSGTYGFVLPAAAREGDTYRISISRPSANSDGIQEDVVIEAPNDPAIPIRAVQVVTIGERHYVVGDTMPFRWYNAGDFGDGSIVNNDLEQLHQTLFYGLNRPPPGSDFEDSYDSCCVDTNGVDRSFGYQPWDGNDTVINQIGFGDGKLDIADLFVTFRRALDSTLVWYERYWSNGVKRANVIPNTFRGQLTGLSASSFKNTAEEAAGRFSAFSTSEPSSVRFRVGGFAAAPGQVAEVPIFAEVQGPNPIRTLLLNLKVSMIDGRANITESVSFWAHPVLGGPSLGGQSSPGGYVGAWLDPNHPGLSGNVQIGTLYVPIPANATSASAYLVHIEDASASPNGVGVFPSTTVDGAIIMASRPNIGWNDGIPNAWRVQYFGGLTDLNSEASKDADADGATNREEFNLGTNPKDSDDHLNIRAGINTDRSVKLRFQTMAGRRYQVEVSNTLTPGTWTTVQSDVLGTGGEVELSSGSGARAGFYRVRAQQ